MLPRQIVSGGQTGADRAALDFALAHGIVHGGWCPKGRAAEDGPIPARYGLTETSSAETTERTEWNVRDSDATVVFSLAPTLSGGSARTVEFCRKYGKPWLHVSRERDGEADSEKLRGFLQSVQGEVLNIAGPRQSEEPGIGQFVREVLEAVISPTQ